VVLGHEGVGKVRKIGSSVRNLEVGHTVGITWIRDSCLCCEPCQKGRENLCEKGYQGTYLGSGAGIWGKSPANEHGGCFSKVVRIESRFAIKLPADLPAEIACPLICGGGTVYESVADYVTVGTKVAVASIGGLGTAAIRFAKLYGGHVTALSRGDAKKDKCLAIGADAFEGCLGDKDKMAALAGQFDVIIDTSPANAELGPYMGMLKISGTYCRVGIPVASDMTFTFGFIPLIFTQKKIAGSIVTGTQRVKHMLELTANNLEAFHDPSEWHTETVSFDKVNEVMDQLAQGKNDKTYRYLLKW
jgi:D-arabinose 1-dehydrogenase-like Zn-dependent alcohol dehydrogenase